MGPRPSALLGLVLCLGQMIHSQKGAPPKPSLRAEPGPVVRRGQPVTFVCSSSVWAELFRLEKKESKTDIDQEPQDGSQGTEARFLIPAVSDDTVGSYRCLYNQGSRWSDRSEPLQLQVTEEDVSRPPPGAPPKPSLRAEPGPVVRRGQPVTFVCRGPAEARLYRLEKDGIRISSYQKSRPQDGSRGSEARFLIPAVSDDTVGSYRCLYHQGSRKSERSEPLDLQVTEEDVSRPPPGPASRDYSVENSIRLGLAGLVLLILVAILVEAGLSQHRAPQGPQEEPQERPLERGDPPGGQQVAAGEPRVSHMNPGHPDLPPSPTPAVVEGPDYPGPRG